MSADSDAPDRCFSVRELARRWRCRPLKVRRMIRLGELPAIRVGDGPPRVTPEAVAAAEAGPLAVRPRTGRRVDRIPKEVADLLET